MVNKSKLFFSLKVMISLGLLLALFWIMRNDIGKVIGILKNSNKIFLIFALLISMAISLGLSIRLKLLVSGQNILLHINDSIYLTFIGYFFNNFLPTAIGGDIVKAHYASMKTNNKSASYAAVLADRVIGVMASLSIAMIGVVFIGREFKNNKIILALTAATLSLILAILFLFTREKAIFLTPNPNVIKEGLFYKIKEAFFKLYAALNLYKNRPIILLKTYLLGILVQASAVLSIYLFIVSLGGDIRILRLFLIVPLVWAVSMLPSLNGLGVREGAFVYFLKDDIGAEMAFSISMLWLGVTILYGIIGGILNLLYPVKGKIREGGRLRHDRRRIA